MKGHVKQRGDRYYAVIYEGRDPVTGRERRHWHPAGTDRTEAERLAAKLAATETGRVDAVRSLTFGAYLTSQWLPAKKLFSETVVYLAPELPDPFEELTARTVEAFPAYPPYGGKFDTVVPHMSLGPIWSPEMERALVAAGAVASEDG